ncbi:MAG: LPS export ABC transporter permease LptF [Pseudomonadota bacterium]|nr:LPS export ABC transporter permease LptF [Pseudomonadota bacterium]
MIFQRALRRELISTAGAVFTTLFSITLTVMLIKILGQAAGGKVASEDVIALIGFAALNYMPVILILTTFISVLLVVTRSYQDSEMVVWFTAGVSLTRWIPTVLSFGLPIVLITALLSLFATPWANRSSTEYRERYEKRADIAKVAPGKFQESSSADRVFFVEGVTGDAMIVRNIFVNTQKNGKNSIVVAKQGRIEFDRNGDKFLVMQKGRRYESGADASEFQVMEFERYGVLVSSSGPAIQSDRSARSLSTRELIAVHEDYARAELLWRIALPLMCLLLMLLAIPLGFVNPRGGRSINLIVALLLFIFYSNMVSLLQASVQQGHSTLAGAWWPVHLVALVTIALMFGWRVNMNSALHPLVWWSRWSDRRRCRERAQ